MGTTGGDGGDIGVDSRQLLLVVVCLFGLVAAAFLAPVAGQNAPFGDGAGDPSERVPDNQGGGGGDSAGDGFDVPEWLRDLFGGGDTGGGDSGTPSKCQVYVESTPKPGAQATVFVTVDGEPSSGVRVWFNGDYVGRTDGRGVVTGEVPFETELNVTVESPVDEPCAFSRTAPVGPSESGAVGSGVSTALASGTSAIGVTPASPKLDAGPVRQQRGGANNTTQFEVASDASIRVEGDPYPGTTVTLVATVRGVPMANASVAVDGETVGTTDERGRYRLSVPDRDSVRVTVSRGEIRGRTTVSVLQLAVGYEPQLAVPGETVTVNVTRNGEPVRNATVAADGETLGTTGPSGRVNFTAPLTTGGTVTATTPLQRATVPVVYAYLYTVGASLLLVVLSTVTTWVTARRRDRETARRVARWWGAVGVLFAGYAVWELPGLGVAAICVLVVALYRHRQAVRSGGATAAERAGALLERCKRGLLRVVEGLEATVDWLHAQATRFGAWLRSLPTSLSALGARFWGWLRTLPGRLLAGLRESRRAVAAALAAAALAAVAVVGTATYAYGVPGFLLSVSLVALAAIAWWLRRRAGGAGTAAASAPSTADSAAATEDGDDPMLRRLWRRLARWVLPETWRTRTPAEVSRAAIERGLPRGPVETLTEAFRDAEYGGRSGEQRRERARAAFDEIAGARDEEGEER
ncbi:DUF4129 domain-containing protein [Haloarcula laminariae]|uniref:DUF4129 domain-containing protein n=1 Tax=Haloarcula laminariae TaxID=2961577 RepID=UPI0021C9D59A|nr:DUF4129 domain-containing protein [Halomicroarcula laminariae]